jgi:hypothetical protein
LHKLAIITNNIPLNYKCLLNTSASPNNVICDISAWNQPSSRRFLCNIEITVGFTFNVDKTRMTVVSEY